MFHRLNIANFYSFAEPAELSFMMDGRALANEKSFVSAANEQRLTKVMAVVCANGAGKTNIIKPFAFLAWFVSRSFFLEPEQPLGVQPHFFTGAEPSKFELDFELDGRLYRYQLALTPERVISEALLVKTSRLFSRLFTREWLPNEQRYELRQSGFGFPARQVDKVSHRVSFISTAAQFGVELAVHLAKAFDRVASNVFAAGRQAFLGPVDVFNIAPFYADHELYRNQMAALLKQWDFGLSNVTVEQVKITTPEGNEEIRVMPFGIHQSGERMVKLGLWAESSGTQAAFVQLSRILPVLHDGGAVIIDELEADLHPLMLQPILEMFFSSKTNPHNAQLIFTCHSVEVLNLLQKTQILLVEKDEHCFSQAWRLSDMEGVRPDDNFYAKYMAGVYGAVPNL